MTIKPLILPVLATSLLFMATSRAAQAASDPFIGEIMWVGYNFCPRGWVEADGQLLSIAQNTALFSLYGTTYGGDGRTTFALPDLRGRVSVHTGDGPGLNSYAPGSSGGVETVTLDTDTLPSHSHSVNASSSASGKHAADSIPGSAKQRIYDNPLAADTTWNESAIGMTGNGRPHENRPPYLTLRACVALVGIFPSRN